MQKSLAGLSIAALGMGLFANAPAYAMLAPFGGGATGTDPLGHAWTANNTSGISSWGEPGNGDGTIGFNPATFSSPDANPHATEFDFIFLKGVSGTINRFGSSAFEDVTTGAAWTPTYVGSLGQEVDFKAPSGTQISPGDKFFVNVIFTGAVDPRTFSFAGLWEDAAFTTSVPEPASMAIFGAGLLGLAAFGRRKHG